MILGIGTDLANIDRIKVFYLGMEIGLEIEFLPKRNKLKPHDVKMKLGLMQNAGLQKKPVLKRLAVV